MIQVLVRLYGSVYLAIVDQTPGLLAGDPENVSSQINTGFLQSESADYILKEDNNFINLES